MKIFSSEQIRAIDEFTIKYEPVSSAELMERAAGQLYNWITERFGRTDRILIFTGPGNNGGDGLALARMLASNRYNVEIYYLNFTENRSREWEINLKRLESEAIIPLNYLINTEQFPLINHGDILVDAIFGSGLKRAADGWAGKVIKQINNSGAKIISIDIPSGMFGEDNTGNSYDSIVKADFTLSFQFPRLAFMFVENAPYVGEWEVLPIGLNKSIIRNTESPYRLVENSDMVPVLKKRNKFDHKGKFGHGLLVAGSLGKMGAAVLGAGSALRTGIGLITCHIPSCGTLILQSCVPEAMVKADKSTDYISDIGNVDSYTAVGVGPGLGTAQESQAALHDLLSGCKKPMVIDADALNILSLNQTWFSLIPAGSILTPHPKEFERMAGKTENSFARLRKQIEFSRTYSCVVVLKGANTSVTTPEGKVSFNNTGNPGMATGGSGDVLTGIILSLLAQGYTSEVAAVLGVYLHGMAGDISAGESGYESIIASDIIKGIGKAFNKIRTIES